MKIMMLVSSMHVGGAERVAATLVNAWAARGDSVSLVPTYSSKGTCFYHLSPSVELIWLADKAGTRAGGWKALFNLAVFKRLSSLRRLIKEEQPDVVVSFLTNVNVAAILATRGLNVPLIVCERTNPAEARPLGMILRCLRYMLYPYSHMVMVQTEDAATSFEQMFPNVKRLGVVPNPVPHDLMEIAPLDADALATTSRKRLIAMGRLVPEKQFDLLIDVFASIAPQHPDWDLWIWGEGAERNDLRARAAELDMNTRIFLPGSTAEPWAALTRGHGFVLSSSVEGFPNVLLEAMAVGLPCVTFDCPSGPREMTSNGQDALLVPPGDREALAEALSRMMGDADLREVLGARASTAVRRRYTIDKVLEQWDALFHMVRSRE